MRKYLILLLLIPLLFSCTTISKRTVEVTGNGTVIAAPEEASFSVNLRSLQPTSKEASTELALLQQKLVQILTEKCGLKDEAIKTGSISINPSYDWQDNKRELIGQEAYVSYSVRVDDLSKLETVLDSITELDGISFSNVALSVKESSGYDSTARKMAIDDAIAKAEDYASSLGLKLGKALKVSSAASYGRTLMLPSFAATKSNGNDAITLDYHADDIELNDTVTVVFELF